MFPEEKKKKKKKKSREIVGKEWKYGEIEKERLLVG